MTECPLPLIVGDDHPLFSEALAERLLETPAVVNAGRGHHHHRRKPISPQFYSMTYRRHSVRPVKSGSFTSRQRREYRALRWR